MLRYLDSLLCSTIYAFFNLGVLICQRAAFVKPSLTAYTVTNIAALLAVLGIKPSEATSLMGAGNGLGQKQKLVTVCSIFTARFCTLIDLPALMLGRKLAKGFLFATNVITLLAVTPGTYSWDHHKIITKIAWPRAGINVLECLEAKMLLQNSQSNKFLKSVVLK